MAKSHHRNTKNKQNATHPGGGHTPRRDWAAGLFPDFFRMYGSDKRGCRSDRQAYGGMHSVLSDLGWQRVWSSRELSQLSMCTD